MTERVVRDVQFESSIVVCMYGVLHGPVLVDVRGALVAMQKMQRLGT